MTVVTKCLFARARGNPSGFRPIAELLDKRLVVVTGKGGVGKTTVAAALGLKAARAGKRTIVCEVAEQERLASLFGEKADGYHERELGDGLFGISIDPERAKKEWLEYQLRSGTLAGLLGGSRIFQYLTAAAPGLTELVTIGKVWELAQLQRKTPKAAPYDLVIVDAPATGHGIAMLRAPQTFSEVARVGPIHRQAGYIHQFLANPASTGVVTVALPEEMPVNETLDLGGRLKDEMGMAIDRIVVNEMLPERFSAAEAEKLESAGDSPAVRAALTEYRRARAQRSQLRRLRRASDAPVATLPFLFVAEFGRDQLETLADKL
jgi:anion-transporting  ArsA/GET3 family ATPase